MTPGRFRSLALTVRATIELLTVSNIFFGKSLFKNRIFFPLFCRPFSKSVCAYKVCVHIWSCAVHFLPRVALTVISVKCILQATLQPFGLAHHFCACVCVLCCALFFVSSILFFASLPLFFKLRANERFDFIYLFFNVRCEAAFGEDTTALNPLSANKSIKHF